ncbi:MAG: diacylglycerol kinase family lipid kinase [Peptococcaceae bacterium]|nr:diacylglycerol kinase family lipid kinase [Peptococcaceae bacterium]
MENNSPCQYYFIINPAAGKGTMQSTLIQQIRTVLPTGQYHIYATTGPGDGERYTAALAEQAIAENRTITVFACGGDGTFFEVVNGAKGRIPVGIIPCGSGNDFAKNIVSDNNCLFDIQAQVDGKIQTVDLIRCNDRLISNACNVGFDADVAYNMTRFKHLPFVSGKLAYILSIVYCLTHQMSYPLTIQIDEATPVQDSFLFTAIANSQIYGGSFKGAPLASIQDGLIDVCMVHKLSLLQIARFIGSFQKGTYLDNKSIMQVAEYYKCQRLHITSEVPICVAFDGDIVHIDELDIEIMPNTLQLIVPQGAKLK